MYVVGCQNEKPKMNESQELSFITRKDDITTLSDDDEIESKSSKESSNKQEKAAPSERRVQHNYHDHMHDKPPSYLYDEEMLGNGHCFTVSSTGLGGAGLSFTIKLHEMLNTVERENLTHIVSWQPHGRCFVIHKLELFRDLLPRFFGIGKFASFQRQLNMYGFQRITIGMDKGGYYHELFLRGRVFLAYQIRRVRIKGTGARAKANPDQEPDFWNMEWLEPLDFHEKNAVRGQDAEKLRMSKNRSTGPKILPRSQQTRSCPENSFTESGRIVSPHQTKKGSFRQRITEGMNPKSNNSVRPFNSSEYAIPQREVVWPDMREHGQQRPEATNIFPDDYEHATSIPPLVAPTKAECFGKHFHPVDDGPKKMTNKPTDQAMRGVPKLISPLSSSNRSRAYVSPVDQRNDSNTLRMQRSGLPTLDLSADSPMPYLASTRTKNQAAHLRYKGHSDTHSDALLGSIIEDDFPLELDAMEVDH